jgi:trehalose 6-phosphate synthase
LFKYVDKYSAAFWGSSFIKEMNRIDRGEAPLKGQEVLKKGDLKEEQTEIKASIEANP